ncbi:MAG: ABC transporter permease [Burkholderiales bacterium]|nr:ABC transporter permease [Burkholderiales bacterium]
MFPALARSLARGAWSHDRGRLALTIIAIALGVALGAAVHLINHSAAAELVNAIRNLSGDADIQVSGARTGIAEDLYALLAKQPEVAVASPLIELDVALVRPRGTLRVLGLDPFRALALQPALLGDAGERLLDLLRPGNVMLSAAAARELGLSAGDTLDAQSGLRRVELNVLAVLPVNDALRQPLALMDIAAAQWLFDQLGRVSRIELRLKPGTDTRRLLDRLAGELPPGVFATEMQIAAEQSVALSRAYRVNLNMLALVALFTGAVLVFSTQTLSALRRRTHFALLRAIGLPARTLAALLLLEALLLGVVGALAGVGLGVLTAQVALTHAGGDLGAGYFARIVASLHIDPWGLGAIAFCGVLAGGLGGFFPALEAARASPAQALRAGDEQRALRRLPRYLPGLGLLAGAAVLSLLPAIDALPVFGYAAIACVLLGALMLMPAYATAALAALPARGPLPLWLALQQLRGTAGYASISLAAILASFSLAVAMLIMIQSFRGSLDHWLQAVLPADLYARAGAGASTWIDRERQVLLRAAEPVERVVFSRFDTLRLDADRPAITLIARDLDPRAPDALPLVAPQRLPVDGSTPIWISEAMRDLFGLEVGARVRLPLAGRTIDTTVAGIWRDYVRQTGAVVLPRDVYIRATADERANEAWIWLKPRHSPDDASDILRRALHVGAEIELREPARLRQLSLAAFDRTFAITYALQVAAVVIGLFGISIGASAQAIARRAEFGVLHQIGMSRRQLGRMLAIEGGLVGALGALAGLTVGAAMSLILIHVINRQSFHWSMDIDVPWFPLVALSVLLSACAAVTAAVSVRRVLEDDIVGAVKEDW